MYKSLKHKETQKSPNTKEVGRVLKDNRSKSVAQKKANNTGLPNNLKTGIEHLSGYAMDDVKVHYNSSKPAQLNAHAYAQGTDIHLASGQEKHLPHEAWHVVQQKQGRVKPTKQLKSKININDDEVLEKEADVMGAKAILSNTQMHKKGNLTTSNSNNNLVQRKIIARIRTQKSDDPHLGRIISELRLEGRAPTDSTGSGQGDHTVAETLINESVRQEVMHMQRKIALNNMMVLARLTLPDKDIAILRSEFYEKYWTNFNTFDGEDQNTILENCIQKYIELANKRPGTAFARDKEVTRGGGGERQAIGLVRELADKIRKHEEINGSDLQYAAQSILDLIDIKFEGGEEERYVNTIVRALQHALLSVLTLPKNQVLEIIYDLITGLGQRDGFPIKMSKNIYDEVVKRLH